MGAPIDVKSEIAGLSQRIRSAASDEHEARGLHMLALQLLNLEFVESQRQSSEAMAQLVLERRAADSGVTVADQKNAAGALLKKRPEDVSAADVLDVVVFSTPNVGEPTKP